MTTSIVSETARTWARYDGWNAAVEAEFFDGTWANRPVYLDMEDEVLARIAKRAGEEGDPQEAFKGVVRPTLYLWPERGHLLDLHIRRLRRWRLIGQAGPPPCLAILSFFSLAAEGMRGDSDFRPNNYYSRLCQRLGFDPKRDTRGACQRIEDDFRRDSLELWAGLNAWLEDQDGALGVPSAYSFDWRSYVGVPISQALLREDERLALRELFLEYRLSPGQQLAASDMLRLLKEWVPRADLSETLKKLFSATEAQGRIADIASVELQAWDGSPPPGREAGDRPDPSTALLLAAHLRLSPRPQLKLGLVVRGSSPVPTGHYQLDASATEAAVEAFATAGAPVQVVQPQMDGWRRVETPGAISFPDLLLATVKLFDTDGRGCTLTRKPRRLVILEQDEEFHMCVEVERCQLGRENLLLAHESLRDALDSVLESCAREGLRSWSPDELQGLPRDWAAWSGVELIDIPQVPDELPDLSVLIPLEWTKIGFGSGFSLPGHSTWLSQAPPEIRLTALIDKRVTATLARTMSFEDAPPVEEELATFEGAAVVALDQPDLVDGDYKIALRESGPRGKPLVSLGFRLRSANFPRLNVELEGFLCSRPSNEHPAGAITAEVVDELSAPFISGAALDRGEPAESTEPVQAVAPAALRDFPPLDLESEVEPFEDASVARSGAAPSCLMGGQHHWELSPADRETMLGRKSATKIDARCVHCGFERWFPPHSRRARPPTRGTPQRIDATGATGTRRVPRHEIAAIVDSGAASTDALLEGLTYSRSGSWALFERLASQVDDKPWFPLESSRALQALGHIEVVVDLPTGRPTHWSMAPTTLAMTARGDTVLCGERSQRIVERLLDDVEALGGQVIFEKMADALTVIRVTGVGPADLQTLAESLSVATRTEVNVSYQPAGQVLTRLPTLSLLRAALPTFVWPAGRLSRDLPLSKGFESAPLSSIRRCQRGNAPWDIGQEVIYCWVQPCDAPTGGGLDRLGCARPLDVRVVAVLS